MKTNNLKFEEWDIDRLIPYARNPRKNDAQVDRMCGAIREFGFRIPIVAKSDGTVVDGHLRLKAAKKLGFETVPVVLADDLTETQIKAFRPLANQSANWAEWDNDLLKPELEELSADGFDLNLTGFDSIDLEMLSTYGEEEEPEDEEEDSDEEFDDMNTVEGDDAIEPYELIVRRHVCPKCGYEFED